MLVIAVFEISMLGNPEHPKKALAPILVTVVGIAALISLVHPLNALPPMLVTDVGIVMLVRIVLLTNALAAIVVTLKTMVETVIVAGIDTNAVIISLPELTAAAFIVPGDNV